jgi:hypothetical protein
MIAKAAIFISGVLCGVALFWLQHPAHTIAGDMYSCQMDLAKANVVPKKSDEELGDHSRLSDADDFVHEKSRLGASR